MSKIAFFSLLKTRLRLSYPEINNYWELALTADLPQFVFDLVSPSFLRLPQVHQAYVKKYGLKPIPINKDEARRLILEAFIEGPRYMRELRQLYTLPKDLRLQIVTELLDERKICFRFCPIGNCVAYELNGRIRVPDNLARRLNTYLRANHRVSLYSFWQMTSKYDYSLLCVLAKNIQERDFGCVELTWQDGKAFLSLNDADVVKNDKKTAAGKRYNTPAQIAARYMQQHEIKDIDSLECDELNDDSSSMTYHHWEYNDPAESAN